MITINKILKFSFFISIVLIFSTNSFGQCNSGNAHTGGANNTQNCTWHQRSIGSFEYVDLAVTRCRRYVFELIPYSGWNMQITGWNGATQVFYQGGTGTRTVYWTATYTGNVRVFVHRTTCLGWQGNFSSTLRYRDHGDLPNTVAGVAATPTAGTWRGGVSTAWNTTTNWDCNTIPVAATRVNIPAPCLNNPTIPTAYTANVFCIRVDGANGAILTTAGTGAINVTGGTLDGRCQ
jgi:hypothetical protein